MKKTDKDPKQAGTGAPRQKGLLSTEKKAAMPREDEDDMQVWRRAGGAEPGVPHGNDPGEEKRG